MVQLEIRQVPGKGRGLFAGQPIATGETVLLEAPFLLYPQQSAVGAVCSHCLRMLQAPGCDVRACPTCSAAAFCSPACAAAAAADPGSHCPQVCSWLKAANMEGLSDEQQSALQLLFRCVGLAAAAAEGVPGAAERQAALLGLAPGPPGTKVEVSTERHELQGRVCFALAAAGAGGLAASLGAQQVAELLARDETNGYGIMAPPGPDGERHLRGTGLYSQASLINHECLPNVARFDAFDAPPSVPGSNTLVQMRALHDIPAGEEVTASYFPLPWSYPERQERCRHQYGFACTCPRCLEEATWEEEGGEDGMAETDAHAHAEHEHGAGCTHGPGGACTTCHPQGQGAAPPGAADPAYISIFMQKFVCPVEDCGGTLAPLAPGADVSECNRCGRRRTEAEFLASLEAEDEE